jgi:selenocysteine lyase/cysteine desulfurase
VGISGLGAGLRYIFSEGLERISTHGQYLIDRLIEGLANVPKVRLYGAKDRSKQVPVVSLNIEGYEPGEVGAILDQAFDVKVRTGLHCAPGAHRTLGTFPSGTVRLSPGYFNTIQEIDLTVHALEKIAKAGKLNVKSECAV